MCTLDDVGPMVHMPLLALTMLMMMMMGKVFRASCTLVNHPSFIYLSHVSVCLWIGRQIVAQTRVMITQFLLLISCWIAWFFYMINFFIKSNRVDRFLRVRFSFSLRVRAAGEREALLETISQWPNNNSMTQKTFKHIYFMCPIIFIWMLHSETVDWNNQQQQQ